MDFYKENDKVLNAIKNNDIDALGALIANGYSIEGDPKDLSPLYSPLGLAIALNYYDVASLLVESGANTCFEDKSGYTPLIISILNGSHKMVGLMLENGAQKTIDLVSGISATTPLALACDRGDAIIVDLLLEHGADTNILGGYLDVASPLSYAANEGNIEIMLNLIEHGAEVNSKELMGNNDIGVWEAYSESSLLNAVLSGNTEAVQLLVNFGADDLGWSPLHRAVATQDAKLVKDILQADPPIINNVDGIGVYPIQYAIFGNDTLILDSLFSYGADLSVINEDLGDVSLIHIAAYFDISLEALDWVIKHTENIEVQDSEGSTALAYAAETGSTENIQLLLDAGANMESQDIDNYTPLHHAIEHHNIEAVELLVEAGADLNIQDKYGSTPLHQALLARSEDSAKILIAAGCDSEIKNNFGRTVVELADGLKLSYYLITLDPTQDRLDAADIFHSSGVDILLNLHAENSEKTHIEDHIVDAGSITGTSGCLTGLEVMANTEFYDF